MDVSAKGSEFIVSSVGIVLVGRADIPDPLCTFTGIPAASERSVAKVIISGDRIRTEITMTST
jgi:hypothetical protein